MTFSGTFWLLWEDEPLVVGRSRLFEFRNGAIIDARTSERRGQYLEGADGIEALFNEEDGEQDIAQFRMPAAIEQHGDGFAPIFGTFDPNADSYSLTWTTQRYETYLAAHPLRGDETDQELNDRCAYEAEQDFGIVRTYGTAFRDSEEIRRIAEQNEREAVIG